MKRWSMLFLATFLAAGSSLAAQDDAGWRQWRGPDRSGRAAGPAWPDNFQGLELDWRIDLGKGYPGPIIAGDRLFVMETVDRQTVAVRALQRSSGKELWKHTWAASGSVPFFARDNGDWVRSTPVFDGETLFAGDMREVLVALRGSDGKELWRVDLPARFETPPPDFGFASSPLVDGDGLYVQAANSVVKLDRRTGETVWRALAQEEGGMSSSGAFSSPLVATLAGTRQLVVLTRQALHGLALDSGEVLWSQPVENFRGMNILTPAVRGDTIFTSSYKGRSYLYSITRNDDGRFQVQESWTNPATAYMSSPAIINGYAYMHLGNQRLDCIDLKTGESRWRSESFGKYWSMAHHGDRLLGLDEKGLLYLIHATPDGFRLLDSRRVSEQPTWGHVAVSGGQVFIRELEGIAAYRWQLSGSQNSAGGAARR